MKKLSVVVGRYPHMQPLRDRAVKSELVEFEFIERFKAVGESFNSMISDQAYDVCEMALIAFMQAAERSTPIRMLPLVTLGGFLHQNIYFNPSYGPLSPFELSGKRIGVRSYSQTTGVWARAALSEQFGLDVRKATWVATDDAHVHGFTDPPNVVRDERPIDALLLAGAVDAIILHPTQHPAAAFASLITDPERASSEWFSRHRIVPVNHVICVAPSVWKEPDLVAEVISMFKRSYVAAGVPTPNDRVPLSYDHAQLSRALDVASGFALEQGLIERPFVAADAVVGS